jgi:hypothetical protein
MFKNKIDQQLVEDVTRVLEQSKVQTKYERALNEALEINTKYHLPIEKQSEYDQIIAEAMKTGMSAAEMKTYIQDVRDDSHDSLSDEDKADHGSKKRSKKKKNESSSLDSIHEEIANSIANRLDYILANEGEEAAQQAFNALTEEEQVIFLESEEITEETNVSANPREEARQRILNKSAPTAVKLNAQHKASTAPQPNPNATGRSYATGPGGIGNKDTTSATPMSQYKSPGQIAGNKAYAAINRTQAMRSDATNGSTSDSREDARQRILNKSAPTAVKLDAQHKASTAPKPNPDATGRSYDTGPGGIGNKDTTSATAIGTAPSTSSITSDDSDKALGRKAAGLSTPYARNNSFDLNNLKSAKPAATPAAASAPAPAASSAATPAASSSTPTPKPAPAPAPQAPKAERPIPGSEGGSFSGQPQWAKKAFNPDGGA